jgi:hypothetical protein
MNFVFVDDVLIDENCYILPGKFGAARARFLVLIDVYFSFCLSKNTGCCLAAVLNEFSLSKQTVRLNPAMQVLQ